MPHADTIEAFPEPEFLEGAAPTPSERSLALVAHLGGLVLSFIVPASVMMTQQDTSQFVVRHAREAVNFQLTLCFRVLLILLAAGGVAAFFDSAGAHRGFVFAAGTVVALLLSIVSMASSVVFTIRACKAALKGRDYRYPLTIRLI